MLEEFNLEKLREEEEKIKKEVERFKKERKGLLPELFSVPGEEIEEKKEYPEEYLLAYKLRKLLTETPIKEIYPDIEADERFKNSTIEKEMKNETLWEYMLDWGNSAIKNEEDPEWNGLPILGTAFKIYTRFKLSDLWPEIKKRFPSECQKIEKKIKNTTLWKNELQYLSKLISKDDSLSAFVEYASLKSSGLWPEIKERFPLECQQIEQGMKNETLWKNALLQEIDAISDGQKIIDLTTVVRAFLVYTYLKLSGLWPEIKKKFPSECQEIEEGMKNETLWKNMIQWQIDRMKFSQTHTEIGGRKENSWWIFEGYFSLSFNLSDLEKTADQKIKELEHQKALHPEKKIPPRPERRSF